MGQDGRQVLHEVTVDVDDGMTQPAADLGAARWSGQGAHVTRRLSIDPIATVPLRIAVTVVPTTAGSPTRAPVPSVGPA